MLVRESIAFQRYRDPKEALGLSINFDDIRDWMHSETSYYFREDSPSNLWICALYEKWKFIKFLFSKKEYQIETINNALKNALDNEQNMDEESVFLTVKELLDHGAGGADFYIEWSKTYDDSIKEKYPSVDNLVRQYINK